MKGASISVSKNPFGYNGLYLATLTAIKPLDTQNGSWTIAEFKVAVSNSQYGESLFLTTKEDAPDNAICSMVVEAFGGTPIVEGTSTEAIMAQLNQCIGRPCAINMIPKANKKTPGGIKYHGFVNTKDFKAVQPVAMVGTVYTGEIKDTPVKPASTVSQDDLPF